MFGKLIIKNSNGLQEQESVFILENYSEIEKQNIFCDWYEKQNNNKISIYCGCHGVPMVVIFDSEKYFITSKIGFQSKHSKQCFYSASQKYKTKYLKGWRYDVFNGHEAYIPVLDNHYFGKKQFEKLSREYLDSSYFFNVSENLTFYGLCAKINVFAWSRFVSENSRIPKDINEYMSFLYKTLKLYYPIKKTKQSLYDFLLPMSSDFKYITNGSKKFFIGIIDNCESKEDENKLYLSDYKISILDYNKKRKFKVQLDGLMYSECIKKNQIKFLETKVMIFGILRFKTPSDYYLETVEFLPITDLGLFVENVFQYNLFNKFTNSKYTYYRPYLPVSELSNKLPEAIVLGNKKLHIVAFDDYFTNLDTSDEFDFIKIKKGG